mmetsp:Transcript_78298/g.162652  ORF Transcript_78298/g.162652 Transcript_78298/m.162652 type:complete len:103 (+) Transcript_78298:923-1231(+)
MEAGSFGREAESGSGRVAECRRLGCSSDCEHRLLPENGKAAICPATTQVVTNDFEGNGREQNRTESFTVPGARRLSTGACHCNSQLRSGQGEPGQFELNSFN